MERSEECYNRTVTEPVEDIQCRTVLRQCRPYLVQDIILSGQIWDYIEQMGLLSKQMIATIRQSDPVEAEQKRNLLDHIESLGKRGFDLFCEVLANDSQEHILEKYLQPELYTEAREPQQCSEPAMESTSVGENSIDAQPFLSRSNSRPASQGTASASQGAAPTESAPNTQGSLQTSATGDDTADLQDTPAATPTATPTALGPSTSTAITSRLPSMHESPNVSHDHAVGVSHVSVRRSDRKRKKAKSDKTTMKNKYSKKHSKKVKAKVLFLMLEWSCNKGGSGAAFQAVPTLLASVPGVKVYCTVTTPRYVMDNQDIEHAKSRNVSLLFPETDKHETKNNSDRWLHENLQKYYRVLSKTKFQDITHIIAFTPNAAQVAEKLLLPNAGIFKKNQVKLVLFNLDIVSSVDEGAMLNFARQAHAVFSFGPQIYNHFVTKYLALTCQPKHYSYLPNLPPLSNTRQGPGYTHGQSVLQILVFSDYSKKGLSVSAKAVFDVQNRLQQAGQRISINWKIRGIHGNDREEVENYLEGIMGNQNMPVICNDVTLNDIKQDLRQSCLCLLMSSKNDQFGFHGYEAIASGTPILVSSRSGLADLLKSVDDHAENFIVNVQNYQTSEEEKIEVAKWASKIIKAVSDAEAVSRAFRLAKNLKESLTKCCQNGKIKDSVMQFAAYFVGTEYLTEVGFQPSINDDEDDTDDDNNDNDEDGSRNEDSRCLPHFSKPCVYNMSDSIEYKHINLISQDQGAQEKWPQLAHRLNLDCKVSDYKMTWVLSGAQEVVYQILTNWKERVGFCKSTVKILADILREIDLRHLADKLESV